MKRDNGKFVKGIRYSIKTQFKKGQHWRKKKPFWNKDWLENEYISKKRTCSDIAKEFGCKSSNIGYWLKKHNIKARNQKETRKIKQWGSKGKTNGMYGIRGSAHHGWKGGVTPERQNCYSSIEWAEMVIKVWSRDKATCQRCLAKSTNRRLMHMHHVIPFHKNKTTRIKESNLLLLCSKCHGYVHSKKNINREFLKEGDQP